MKGNKIEKYSSAHKMSLVKNGFEFFLYKNTHQKYIRIQYYAKVNVYRVGKFLWIKEV